MKHACIVCNKQVKWWHKQKLVWINEYKKKVFVDRTLCLVHKKCVFSSLGENNEN